MEKDLSTERKLRTVSVFLLLSAVLAAILSSFFPQLSLVSFACAAVFLMTLCSEQSGRVVMMLFALLVVPLPAVMTAGDGSAVLSISSVLFSSAAAVLRRLLFGDFPLALPGSGDSDVYENGFVRREIRHDGLSPDAASCSIPACRGKAWKGDLSRRSQTRADSAFLCLRGSPPAVLPLELRSR